MQQMYSVIRAQGANNLVFVSGNNWAAGPSSLPVSGTNIVNGVHAYTCPQHPPPGCPLTNEYDPSQILDRWRTVGASSPVMITEFGWPNKADGLYDQNVISYAEAQHWSWNAFAWTAVGGPFNLNADLSPPYEPTPAGQSVLTGLANN